jgi:CheY-like chemotaxis protein
MTQPYGLVIEADTDLVTIFSQALKSAAYATEVWMSHTEALAKLEQAIPRLLVLDPHLPEVSGVDILKRVQTNRRFTSTHIIVTTADPLLADTLRDMIDMVLIKTRELSATQSTGGTLLVNRDVVQISVRVLSA